MSQDYEIAHGYCLDFDEDRLPDIDFCEVERVSDQVFLEEYYVGNEDDPEKRYHSHIFARTFFYHYAPALAALLEHLEFVKARRAEVDRDLEMRLSWATEALAKEQEQGR